MISRIDIHISLQQNGEFKAEHSVRRGTSLSPFNLIHHFHNKDDSRGNNIWPLVSISDGNDLAVALLPLINPGATADFLNKRFSARSR